ncbi:Gfo/Idh/MocA family oxidoreductase [Psychromonas sp. MME2]|uniref:Gfo/Idh/MocA family protein n=1 Tax=unclassified Psychromonas TaxID=2614957 RepID=UPI00339D1B8C
MKLGIVGSGNIVKEALAALTYVPEITIQAIVVREKSRAVAEELQKQYSINKIYCDYDRFLEDADIEMIYIGIPNSLHHHYSKRALLAGKHVICEKPFTSNYHELKELADLAREKKLYLFEAITLIHSKNLAYVKEKLAEIGEIKLIQCNYSQFSSRYPKYQQGEVLAAFDPAYSGGSLFDINVYNIHFVCRLFGKPESLHYHANIGFNGIDTSGVLVMNYPHFTAICSAAKDSQSPCHATVQGTKGYVKIAGPTNEAKEVEFKLIEEASISTNKGEYSNRMVDEFKVFAALYHSNNYAACLALLDHSLVVIDVLTEARLQAGIHFPNDLLSELTPDKAS